MRLLSWNIQWGCGCDGHVNFSRIADVIRQHDADVICLQEIAVNHPGLAGSSGEDQVAILQDSFAGYSAHYGIGSDLDGENGARRLFGNLILSRLPVRQVFRHSLPCNADGMNPSMPRMALEVIISANAQALRVVTTHLEYYSPNQRAAQLDQLRRIHEEAYSYSLVPLAERDLDPPFMAPPRPLSSIYCGDFNCEPVADELHRLTQPFSSGAPRLRDAWPLAHPGVAHADTVGLHGCPWPDRRYCCDYFFVSEDLCERIRGVSVNQETDASDHQPILLELA